jgi:hypothetical protein
MRKPDFLKCSTICGGVSDPIKGAYAIVCDIAKVAWVGISTDAYHRYSENRNKLGLGNHGCSQLQSAYDTHGTDALEFLVERDLSLEQLKQSLKDRNIEVYSRGCANEVRTVRMRNRKVFARNIKTDEITVWESVVKAIQDGFTNASWAAKGMYNPSAKHPKGTNIYAGCEWGYLD